MAMLLNLIGGPSGRIDYKAETLSGLTVALALVPEAVAFSIIAKVDPLIGLQTAFMIGLVTAIFGGRPGMISGATGAIAVVAVGLVVQHGVEYLFSAVILMGIIQMLIGVLKLGKFIRLVPHSVIYGFLNGLAIIIFTAQLPQLQDKNGDWLSGQPLFIMLGLIALTMAIIYFLPRVTKAFPGGLAAILVITAIVIFGDLQTRTVGDIASIAGTLPTFHLPDIPINLETLWIILPYAIVMALVGLIESLLTLAVIDEMTETRGKGNRECLAQGGANLLNGFFGGMGGCAMIGQSIINTSSGGRNRLSGIVGAVALLSFVLVGSAWIEQVPMAALVGLMFMVSIGTFEWASLRIIRKVPFTDVFVMFLVAGITVVFHNLAVAVIAGVVLSALAFAWENAKRIRARKYIDEDGAKHYEIYGPLFFGSVTTFLEKFDVASDPDTVIIDFAESRVADHSAIEALNTITARYAKASKRVSLRNLSPDCRLLLKNAHTLIDVNYYKPAGTHVAVDELA